MVQQAWVRVIKVSRSRGRGITLRKGDYPSFFLSRPIGRFGETTISSAQVRPIFLLAKVKDI